MFDLNNFIDAYIRIQLSDKSAETHAQLFETEVELFRL